MSILLFHYVNAVFGNILYYISYKTGNAWYHFEVFFQVLQELSLARSRAERPFPISKITIFFNCSKFREKLENTLTIHCSINKMETTLSKCFN